MKYVNMTRVGGVQQVLLHVRVAEVDRTAIRQLGINMFQGNDRFFGGSTIRAGQRRSINPISIAPAQNTSRQYRRTSVFRRSEGSCRTVPTSSTGRSPRRSGRAL